MKFNSEKISCTTAGLGILESTVRRIGTSGNTVDLECVLRSYSGICGEQTKKRLVEAIMGRESNFVKDDIHAGVDYSDTPIRGRSYVYLWFDSDGELFYIGKGTYSRASDIRQRSAEFQKKAEGGHYVYVAYNMDEVYALDLERVLIWEVLLSGRHLLNVSCGSGADAIRYCKNDRDGLLWYWDHEGTIDCFSKLTEIEIIYDARDKDLNEILDERYIWWSEYYHELKTNDSAIIEEMARLEEKKRRQREYRREYWKNKKLNSKRLTEVPV